MCGGLVFCFCVSWGAVFVPPPLTLFLFFHPFTVQRGVLVGCGGAGAGCGWQEELKECAVRTFEARHEGAPICWVSRGRGGEGKEGWRGGTHLWRQNVSGRHCVER